MPVYLSPPPRNPIAQAVAAVIGALVMVGAFMLGMVALAIVAGLILIAGVVAWFRTRRLRKHLREQADAFRAQAARSESIDAEYTVISTENESERELR